MKQNVDLLKVKKDPIYTNDKLNKEDIERLKPLLESSFSQEFGSFIGGREKLKNERLNLMAGLYANRERVSRNENVSPLNEDMKIFSQYGNIKKLFEDASAFVTTPSNTLTMPNVTSPIGASEKGGVWNPNFVPGTGDIPTYSFGLQTQVAVHCIGFDLIPTIQVDTPTVRTTYKDVVYGGGEISDAENKPKYINLKSALFDNTFAKKTAKLKRAQSELIILGDVTDKKALKIRFISADAIGACYTVEVLSTGEFESTSKAYTENNKFSVKEVLDLVNNDGKTSKVYYTESSDWDKDVEIKDLSADFVSVFRDPIIEAATNNNSKRMSREQHEKGISNKLNVIVLEKQFDIKGVEIKADTTNIKIQDYAAQGINVIADLYNGVHTQIIQTIDGNILEHLYALGVENALGTYKSTGVNNSLYIAAPTKTELSFKDVDCEFKNMLDTDVKGLMGSIPNSIQSSGFENQTTHADRFFARVLLVADFVGHQSRTTGADFLVAGGAIVSMMKKHSTYSISPIMNTLTQTPNLHFAGTIFNTINVYKNPRTSFNDPRILMGIRGDNTNSGAKFLAYDLASSTHIKAESTMSDKITISSRFEIADIGHHPELNYFTWVAINEYGWA